MMTSVNGAQCIFVLFSSAVICHNSQVTFDSVAGCVNAGILWAHRRAVERCRRASNVWKI